VFCVLRCALISRRVFAYGSVPSGKGLRSVVTNYFVLETANVRLFDPSVLGVIVVHFMQKANILAAIHDGRLLVHGVVAGAGAFGLFSRIVIGRSVALGWATP